MSPSGSAANAVKATFSPAAGDPFDALSVTAGAWLGSVTVVLALADLPPRSTTVRLAVCWPGPVNVCCWCLMPTALGPPSKLQRYVSWSPGSWSASFGAKVTLPPDGADGLSAVSVGAWG